MDYLAAVGRAIDFIERDPRSRLTPGAVSRASFYSTPHMYRVFRAVVGMGIKEYIRARRLSIAAEELLQGRRKVIDLAFDLRWSSPEAFSRAFKAAYGLSPLRFRESANEVRLFERVSPRPRDGRLSCEPSYASRKETEVEGPSLRTSLADGRNLREIPAFWASAADPFTDPGGAASREPVYGVYTSWRGEDAFTLVAGRESRRGPASGEAPRAAVSGRASIPGRKYAVFPVAAFDAAATGGVGNRADAGAAAWNYIYGSWFPLTGRERPRGLVDFERYLPDGTAEIFIPVVD